MIVILDHSEVDIEISDADIETVESDSCKEMSEDNRDANGVLCYNSVTLGLIKERNLILRLIQENSIRSLYKIVYLIYYWLIVHAFLL